MSPTPSPNPNPSPTMPPRHHPGEELLLAHAAGTLGAGPGLIVAVHLEACGACRALVAALEVAGGVMMAELPPVPMSSLALERALAAIERPVAVAVAVAGAVTVAVTGAVAAPKVTAGLELPLALRGRDVGPWRWLAPGMRWSRVAVPEAPRANVVLMRGRPDRLLPAHGHRGSEFTQVLCGAIYDGDVRYGPGDMFVADDATHHHLRVADEGECLCIAAIEGRMRMSGLIGRIVQPLVGP